jgi:ABC-2 type transport system permease protein
MSPRRILATTVRVLSQLRHDHRTVGLILVVPSAVMVLLYYVFDGAKPAFDNLAPMMLAIFPFIIMFLITSVAMLRERTTGTLERLMTMPIAKIDLLLGYAIAFGFLAILQSSLASWVALSWLDVTVAGGAGQVLLVALLAGLTGMALGLFASAFAATEFQAVQFMPAFIAPQLFLCGLFIPRDQMAEPLRWAADVLPLPYVVEAIQNVAKTSGWSGDLKHDLIVVGAFGLGSLILSAATLRRQH